MTAFKGKSKYRSKEEATAWGLTKPMVEIHSSYLVAKGVPQNMAEIYVRRWFTNGWIELVKKEGHRKIYGHAGKREAPVVPGQEKTPEAAMWKVMNRYTTFTPVDLKAMVEVAGFEIELQACRNYCRQLLAAEFLRVREQGIHGIREFTYQLINQTGLKAPIVRQVAGVLDPNTGKFHANLREGHK
ncbi:MAG: hypothetical protein ACRBB0_25515 [Pelagimonas sp.]|uniref:hypothetical protein n=1 Tax=Pelagimonas sp. TaxID=2073170 RepID=UPI003D6AEF0B